MKKRAAVMQPYIFPYIGYFNLIQASDNFIFYDDVSFRKKSWINRNQINLHGKPYLFTVPLSKSSPNNLICELETFQLDRFANRFIRQLEHTYGHSEYFERGMDYVCAVLFSGKTKISELAIKSVKEFFSILSISKEFWTASKDFSDSRDIGRADRLIRITKELNCGIYLNPINGLDLYSRDYFKQRSVDLYFLEPLVPSYSQTKLGEFIPKLSSIDLLMNLSDSELKSQINAFRLL
jgi:hypothetical protein